MYVVNRHSATGTPLHMLPPCSSLSLPRASLLFSLFLNPCIRPFTLRNPFQTSSARLRKRTGRALFGDIWVRIFHRLVWQLGETRGAVCLAPRHSKTFGRICRGPTSCRDCLRRRTESARSRQQVCTRPRHGLPHAERRAPHRPGVGGFVTHTSHRGGAQTAVVVYAHRLNVKLDLPAKTVSVTRPTTAAATS